MNLWSRRLIGIALVITGGASAVVAAANAHESIAPYVPFGPVFGFVSAAFVLPGIWFLASRAPSVGSTPLNVISWWWIPIGLLVIVVTTWSSLAILLSIADTAPDKAKQVELRADSVKTALTVGAGTAGAAALMLGVRRQWLGERAQFHTEHDSSEQRVTELYTKAADQLGHDKAAVRLAGIYALERVGQNNAAHRQTVLNVLCAYLRLPSEVNDDEGRAVSPSNQGQSAVARGQDVEVRLAIQAVLKKHLTWWINPDTLTVNHPNDWAYELQLEQFADPQEALFLVVQLGKRYHRRTDQMSMAAGFLVLLQDVLSIQDTVCRDGQPKLNRAEIAHRVSEVATRLQDKTSSS
jgi:hypothetical protein